MDTLKLHACSVDLRGLRVLRRDGTSVPLSAREAQVLRFLAERAGEAVDRQTLYTAVWGFRRAVESRAVDALMKRLRIKIEEDPSDPRHLLTVHGEGYRFEPISAAPVEAEVGVLVVLGRPPLEEVDPAALSSWTAAVDQRARGAGGRTLDRSTHQACWLFADPVTAVAFALAGLDGGVGARGAATLGDRTRLLRMVAAILPGRVLLDEALYVEVAMAAGIRDRVWRRLGGVRLTLDGAPERVVETGGDDGRAGLRAGDGNLPPPPNSTFGRDREVERALDRLRHAQVLTLTGTGGVGKTRLSLGIGAAWRATGGGAWFCDLTSCQTVGEVEASVARSLDAVGAAGPRLDHVLALLRGDVVVLDNAEQALDAVRDAVSRWAGLGPALLVTSRERLGIGAEEVQEVAPLGVEDGYALFAERARALGLPIDDPESVRQLILRVDGLPLAIELAVSRTEVSSAARILAQIDRSLSALGHDPARAPRHMDLRATVQWSWDLLEPVQQRVLLACSTFASPFDPDAAVAVAGGERDSALDALQALRRKGLVAPGSHRLALYAAVRAFGVERTDPELGLELRDRQARWFARWGTEDHIDALSTRGGELRLAAMADALPDLRRAFEHAATRDADDAVGVFLAMAVVLDRFGQGAEIERYALTALALGRQTSRVQLARIYDSASREILLEGDAVSAELPETSRIRACRSYIASRLHHYEDALRLIEPAIPRLREAEDDVYLGKALWLLGNLQRFLGGTDWGPVLREALAVAERLGDGALQCQVLQVLAEHDLSGDLDGQLAAARGALDLALALPTPPREQIGASLTVASLHALRDEPGPATHAATEALQQALRSGWRFGTTWSLRALMALALAYRGADEMRRLAGIGSPGALTPCYVEGMLALAELAEGRPAEASAMFDRVLATRGLHQVGFRRFRLGRSLARLALGDVEGAAADVAVAASAAAPSADLRIRILAVRAVVRASAGDPESAATDLAEAAALVRPPNRLFHLELDLVRAWLTWTTGGRAEARELLAGVRHAGERRGLAPTTGLGACLAALDRAFSAEP